jgi:A/G-specific adenine glycosylase
MNDSLIVEPLLDWFKREARDLPWRKTYDPYHVWISEIMLQQTQMDRGVTYFLSWIDRFPSVECVAVASLQEILKRWEGLGYYARARNLHKAAKIILEDYGGIVPCSSEILLTLPGVGLYTAAAIASIAGNEDIPAIDANVCRVFARVFDIQVSVGSGDGKKAIEEYSWRLLPQGRANQYNQAVMELGGTICTPKNPRCSVCPIHLQCKALKNNSVNKRPIKQKKAKTVEVTKIAGLIRWKDKIYIQQRQADDLWGNLWDFPGSEVQGEEISLRTEAVLQKAVSDSTGLDVRVGDFLVTVKHQYTNHKVTLHCYLCELAGEDQTPILRSARCFKWITPFEFAKYGFPSGARKIIEYVREQKIL